MKCITCRDKITKENQFLSNGYVRKKCKKCLNKESNISNKKKYKLLKEWRNFK